MSEASATNGNGNGNGTPWWFKTWSRAVTNFGPLVVGFFVLLGVVVVLVWYILTHPATEAHAEHAELQSYMQGQFSSLQEEYRTDQQRVATGLKQICKLLAGINHQDPELCNF